MSSLFFPLLLLLSGCFGSTTQPVEVTQLQSGVAEYRIGNDTVRMSFDLVPSAIDQHIVRHPAYALSWNVLEEGLPSSHDVRILLGPDLHAVRADFLCIKTGPCDRDPIDWGVAGAPPPFAFGAPYWATEGMNNFTMPGREGSTHAAVSATSASTEYRFASTDPADFLGLDGVYARFDGEHVFPSEFEAPTVFHGQRAIRTSLELGEALPPIAPWPAFPFVQSPVDEEGLFPGADAIMPTTDLSTQQAWEALLSGQPEAATHLERGCLLGLSFIPDYPRAPTSTQPRDPRWEFLILDSSGEANRWDVTRKHGPLLIPNETITAKGRAERPSVACVDVHQPGPAKITLPAFLKRTDSVPHHDGAPFTHILVQWDAVRTGEEQRGSLSYGVRWIDPAGPPAQMTFAMTYDPVADAFESLTLAVPDRQAIDNG